MARIKVAVTPESWEQSGQSDIEPPKPGVYTCRIVEANTGYSKGDDNQPDKDRARLEIVFQVIDPKAATRGNDGGSALNSRLWYYLTYGENVQWKLAGFLKALGIAYKKVGSNLEFDLDTAKIAASISDADPKTMKAKPAKKTGHDGMLCRVKVKADSNRDGEYRAGVASVLPPKDEDEADSDFEDDAVDGDVEEEVEEDEAMEEEEVEEYETHDEAELKAASVADLKTIAATLEIDIKGKKKSEVVAAILEAEAALVEASEEEDGDDEAMDEDEEFIEDDEEEMSEDETEAYTDESLKAMSIDDFKEVAKAFDIKVSGKKKSAVIAEILAAQTSDDSNENPF